MCAALPPPPHQFPNFMRCFLSSLKKSKQRNLGKLFPKSETTPSLTLRLLWSIYVPHFSPERTCLSPLLPSSVTLKQTRASLSLQSWKHVWEILHENKEVVNTDYQHELARKVKTGDLKLALSSILSCAYILPTLLN